MTGRIGMTVVVGALAVASQAMGAEPAAPSVDACALLDAADVQQAVKLPVAPGVRRDAGMEDTGAYSSSCVWVLKPDASATPDPDKPLGGRSFVILNVQRWPAGSGLAHTFLDAFYKAAADGEIPSQPQPRQYGDAALSWGDGLAVRLGDVSFGVSVFIPGESKQRRDALQELLAPHILRRLAAPR